MKNFSAFFIFFAFFFNSLLGVVVEAPNLDVIEKEIDQLDEHALVIFDVDYTLIVPNDLILGVCGEKYLKKLRQKVKDDKLISQVYLQCEFSLINEKVTHLLEKLKEKKIKSIALTAISTGPLGLIPSLEDWRIDQLRSLNLHFDWSFPSINAVTFHAFKGERGVPVFKKGILASADIPKGEVLAEFLKHLRWKPSKIIFVDDRLDFIESVEEEMKEEGIPSVSFYYTEGTKRHQFYELDQQIADFQINYLIEKEKWLSDKEAKELLFE